MEENINIFALVLDELNKNDMWFTTKADPTAEEASSYYKLDEYGEPTEATVKKIEKEVNSLIGDGAVYIEDAVELWVNDALVDCKIDYKDNLVTQFEDKPVVDNIEAYENPVQFPQSKKVEGKLSDKLKKMSQTPNPTYIAKCTLIDGDKKYPNTYLLLNHKDSNGMEGTDVILEYSPMNNLWYNCDYTVKNLKKVKQVSTLDELIDFMKSVGIDLSSMRTEKGIEIGMNDMINDNLYRYVVGDNESDPELLESKKQETKTKKTEGAGAGYHIGGIINIKNINSFKIISQEGPDNYGDITATVDCDIDVTLTEMSASSYYYGNDINVDVPAKVTGLIVKISEDDEQNDIGVDESSIKELLDGTKFKTLIGGGWTHTTFTGGIQATDNDITDSEYYYSYFTEIDIQISDENIIKYIDKVVEGENFFTEFLVYDKDGDIISDEFTAEEADYNAVDKAQDDAIEFAKANKGVRVVKQTYRELADGDLDNYDTEPEVVWEREYNKNYKFDDEVDESKKVVEAKELKFKVNDIVEDKTGVGKIMEIDPEHPEGLIYGVQFSNVDLPDDKDDIGLWWCKEGDIYLVTDKAKIDKYNKWFNTEYNKTESLDNHEYVSIYDEINSLLNIYVSTNEDKLKLYNNFNLDKPLKDLKGDNEDVYYDWLEDFKDTNYRELRDYLNELEEDDRLSDWRNKNVFDESKKAERRKKQIEAFKTRKVNFSKCTKEENYQRRLDEVNNKSKNLISDLFSSNDFDSDSPAGQIVMRTSEMFNALSDKGYDVEVTFDNGESTSAIQLGQQGGKVMITITNTDQPLRAFTSGNFEINDQNIKILQDIQSQIEVL